MAKTEEIERHLETIREIKRMQRILIVAVALFAILIGLQAVQMVMRLGLV